MSYISGGRVEDPFKEATISEGKWSIKNAADIKSLADRLDGKIEKEQFIDGHPVQWLSFPSAKKAARFCAALKIFGAKERLIMSHCRFYLSSSVELWYRNRDKTDIL